ncbi:MAG: T9SS type A sorting domain-containing protein [Tannerella sp.]|jgi:hypothetical protein|nr:T9SS type A sorting domain-containing protein [Tannerella sp.]
MEGFIISWLFCLVSVHVFGQDVCYYLFDEKLCYEVSAARFLMKSETMDIPDIEDALRNPIYGNLKNVYEMGGGFFVIEMDGTNKEELWKLHRQFASREDVIFTSPIFGDMPPSAYSNVVWVRLKSQDYYPIFTEYVDSVYNIIDIQGYKLTLPHNSEKDAMQIAIELYEENDWCISAEPNFIILCPFEWCPFEPEQPGGNMNDVQDERKIVLYPNPANDVLYVDLGNETAGSYDIRLYNSTGKIQCRTKAREGIVELDVSKFPNGIYFMRVSDDISTKPFISKILVKH